MNRGGHDGRLRRIRRWLRPGMGIKRWLLVMLIGLTILATAGALLIRILFREVPADSTLGQLFELASLNFLPDLLREFLNRSMAQAVGPAIASMLIYLLMATVLALKPQGLFPVRHG